jgi:hypothetical protein
MGSTKSPCAVEGCLSRGFAGLFSTRSCLQLDRDRRVSYTERASTWVKTQKSCSFPLYALQDFYWFDDPCYISLLL